MAEHDTSDEAVEAAKKAFFDQAIQQWFTAPMCNRFYVQHVAGDRFVLSIGSIGSVGVEGDKFRDVASVVATVSVSAEMLDELFKVYQGIRHFGAAAGAH